jgi:hypothetical protein
MSGTTWLEFLARVIPVGAVLVRTNAGWWREAGEGTTQAVHAAALHSLDDPYIQEWTTATACEPGDAVRYDAAGELFEPPASGSLLDLMAKRIASLEAERAQIWNAARRVPSAPASSVVDVIWDLRCEISVAKETLAPFCPEADPSRCGLEDVVDLLVGDVLEGLGDEPWAAARRISALESEAATLRAILASVPAPEDEP